MNLVNNTKPLVLASNLLQGASLVMLVGSFFTDDDKKKSNLRKAALVTFIVGYGIQFTKMYKHQKYIVK